MINITINEIKTSVIRKFKFKMKTSLRNVTKLRVALQNMYSTSPDGCFRDGHNIHYFRRFSGDLIKNQICHVIKISEVITERSYRK